MQILTLTGNVGRDPEVRTTQKGDTVCSFSVASKQGYGRDAPTEWFRCTVWGKRGETIREHVRKGMKVTIVGEFTIGAYEGKPQYELRVNHIDWQPAGDRQPVRDTSSNSQSAQDDDWDSVPF